MPSTNTLTALAVWPPAVMVRKPRPFIRSSDAVTPGASAARSRKFRLGVGSFSIWSWVTLVATSEVRVSTSGVVVTSMSATWTADVVSV